jgi:hypothetical protein
MANIQKKCDRCGKLCDVMALSEVQMYGRTISELCIKCFNKWHNVAEGLQQWRMYA